MRATVLEEVHCLTRLHCSCDVNLFASSPSTIRSIHDISAHDIAISKQHKSISASDVLKALEAVEFGDLVDPLQKQLKSVFSFHLLYLTS